MNSIFSSRISIRIIGAVRCAVACCMIYALALQCRPVEAQQASSEKVRALIEQLGAEKFDDRETARERIAAIGLPAFNVLYAAREHRDLETRLAVETLLQQIEIRWIDEDNSEEAREIMKGFGAATSASKQQIMKRLDRLELAESIEILLRVVRFEDDERISKRAALSVMESKNIKTAEPDELNKILQTIRATLQDSPRPAANWLTAWIGARTITSQSGNQKEVEANEAKWNELEKLVADEFELLNLFPRSKLVTRDLVGDLLIWQAINTLNRNQDQKSIAQYRDFLTLISGELSEIASTIDRLEKSEAWLLIVETHRRYTAVFEEIPEFLYSVALAHRELGDEAKTNELVASALDADASADRRIRLAYNLEKRGLKKWAGGEYQKVIDTTELVEDSHTTARSLYSEMVFDMGDAVEAAEILRPTAEAIMKDDHISEQIRSNYEFPIESVVSRHFYYTAKAMQRSGEYGAATESLTKALDHDPTDADALITMYRVSEYDKELRKETLVRLKEAVGQFRDDIRIHQQKLIESGGNRARNFAVTEEKRALAMANNQLAWLVSNTTGDFKEAIRCSHRSLELRPETASYFDTLAHCYYADDDFENAVKYQKRAAELEPHVEIIQKQLKVFSEALKQGRKMPARD